MKFQASLAIHLLTVALLLEFLQKEKRFSRLVFWLSVVLITTSLFEMIYITYQAAQGQTSHYNLSTPFLAAMYSVMGVSAIALVGGTAGLVFSLSPTQQDQGFLPSGPGLG
ncbi:hypothetical protein VZ95_05740 [Elstera litoralis]|uniref:Uncharacterized protein n=2 Tax=Elstera litoralis TaxID=552518 RepID=A0A0F3IUV8_9PROT|nr:hypothetical protein VZ95_05740 [Elstera litoralis]